MDVHPETSRPFIAGRLVNSAWFTKAERPNGVQQKRFVALAMNRGVLHGGDTSIGTGTRALADNPVFFQMLGQSLCREHCVRMNNPLRSLSVWLAGLFLLMAAAPVAAAVQITFYSKELVASFPPPSLFLEGPLIRPVVVIWKI